MTKDAVKHLPVCAILGDKEEDIMEEGQKTKKAFRGLVYKNDRDPLEDIKSGNFQWETPSVREGVEAFTGDERDALLCVKKAFKEHLGKACPRTILEWLRGTPPSTKNRRNNFDLCMALGMDLNETAAFFRKYYQSEAFNFKNGIDAIYAYALWHKKSYAFVETSLRRLKTCDKRRAGETCTEEIAETIFEETDAGKFLSYMANHCYDREMFYGRARKEILDLMESCAARSHAELHERLMGFNFQSYEKEKVEKSQALPKMVTEDLPSDQTFGRIQAGKPVSYDTLRKTMIILAFYDFYSQAGENTHILQNLMDFYEETDQRLISCGFTPLYVRNPFDALMVSCARDPFPVYRFYALNDLRFNED